MNRPTRAHRHVISVGIVGHGWNVTVQHCGHDKLVQQFKDAEQVTHLIATAYAMGVRDMLNAQGIDTFEILGDD